MRSSRYKVYRDLAEGLDAQRERDELIAAVRGGRVKAHGGRPQEVTLAMVREAMAELVNGRPPRRATQEAVQNLHGWDRKTIRARASEYPGGWAALRSSVETTGE